MLTEGKILKDTIKNFFVITIILSTFSLLMYLLDEHLSAFVFGGFAFIFWVGLIFAMIEKFLFLRRQKRGQKDVEN